MFDVAVVTPTILRGTLLKAARSVYAQDFHGRIQLLIGIDRPLYDRGVLDAVRAECPPHVSLTILDLGYSTSQRHGGCHSNAYGGSLRTILSYAANSRYVAYLDDNDWFAADHLSSLKTAIAGRHWAHSLRWLADSRTGWPICRDEWDAVGPGRGINQARFGGFVQPSELMIDKIACDEVLPMWARAAFPDGSGEDRLVFAALTARHPGAGTGRYSCCTVLTEDALGHAHHAREFAARGLHWLGDRGVLDRAARDLAAAASAVQDGGHEAACAIADRVLIAIPTCLPALRLRAVAAWKAGRTAEALDAASRALSLDDTVAESFAPYVRMLFEDGHAHAATQVLARAARRFCRNGPLLDLHAALSRVDTGSFVWPAAASIDAFAGLPPAGNPGPGAQEGA